MSYIYESSGKAGTEMEARYKNFNRRRFAATGIFICCSIALLALCVVIREDLNGWLQLFIGSFFSSPGCLAG